VFEVHPADDWRGGQVNFGDCPYEDCDETLEVAVPDKSPQWFPIECPSCHRKVWYKASRIFPEAWTEAAFLEKFEVDDQAKTVREKNPNPVLEALLNKPLNLDFSKMEMPISMSMQYVVMNSKGDLEKCEPTRELFEAGKLFMKMTSVYADGREEYNVEWVTAMHFSKSPALFKQTSQ
jgi:hypothetical protein